MRTIRTDRLELVPATAELVRAEIEDLPRFFSLLNVAPADEWPSENLRDVLPLFLDGLCEVPTSVGWLAWYWIDRSERQLVGGGGFKGQPSEDGFVEIGYETRRAHRRSGYAREAVGALTEWALTHSGVHRVIAETHEANAASVALLGALAFVASGAGSEPGLIRFERSCASV